MPDRENIITHLQIINTWAAFARERDLQFFTAKHLEDIVTWTDDAIALIKDQEVEPEIHMGGISLKHNDPELIVYCGACKGQMVCKYEEYSTDYMKNQYKYCHHCGRKVKWE